MGTDLTTTQNQMNAALGGALDNAAAIITKEYLSRLETYEIMEPTIEDEDIDIASCGRFYRLTKLVMNKNENFLKKLTTVVNVASSVDCSLATIIRSDGHQINYYFGIISKNSRGDKIIAKNRREADAAAFQGALSGNLIGSALTELSCEEVRQFRATVLEKQDNCFSSVSGIVALRDENDNTVEGYVQGIENLVDSLKGQKYTVIMLADPVSTSKIQVIKQGYELLYTQLSVFEQSIVTLNEGDSMSLSKANTQGISEGISKGISLTQSQSKSRGVNFGVSASVSLGVPFIVGGQLGLSAGVNSSKTEGRSKTDTSSESRTVNRSETSTSSTSLTSGKSLQLSNHNRSVKSLLDKIDKHLERLDKCESFGAFECAAYVIAESRETALTVASNYNALMRGENSNVQASYINSWYKDEDKEKLGRYMSCMVHPRFIQYKDAYRGQNNIVVTPASIVSGNELALQIGLPKKSVIGVTVIPMAPFGRNAALSDKEAVKLGNLYHMGNEEIGTGVYLDKKSFASHTFVTGSTGTGKSNTVYHLLDALDKTGVKYLVIEPAKGEYKHVFGGRKDVAVYGTNPMQAKLLRLNPFSFPESIHVLEHIDRLIEILNACWPMYAAMPAVLKDAIEQIYIRRGWNMTSSICEPRVFPTFRDLMEILPTVVQQSNYSKDTQSDYIGALYTRVKSLTNGINGQIFCSYEELSGEALFDKNVIVDLSRVGSMETKALLMGILVMKLQEYRMSGDEMNSDLRHVTVLEEAHNILRRTSDSQSQESSNLQGKSVEMIANAIAEMRTYGEGFIIADQAPGLMDSSVIRNTNTKIIMRLPDESDRQLVGKAATLNDDQIVELSKLPLGVAAVYQNNWLEPVLCRVAQFKGEMKYHYEPELPKKNEIADKVCMYLAKGGEKPELSDEEVDTLEKWIQWSGIDGDTCAELRTYVTDVREPDTKIGQRLLYQIVKGKSLLDLSERINIVEEKQRVVDCQIIGILDVSKDVATEIRKQIFSYAAEFMKRNGDSYAEELLRYGGVK